MHLSEGVLNAPALLGGLLFGAGGVALGLRRLPAERLPLAALLAAAFFVAATLHVPVGPGSVHLLLNGLAGLLLGWAVFPALAVALLLQALLFGFGGFAVLGVNLLIMALPGVAAHFLLARLPGGNPRRAAWAGALAGVLGVAGAGALTAGFLALSGGRLFAEAIGLILAAHLPVMAADAFIGAAALSFLCRVRPEALPGALMDARIP